jgi:hypothetical protein
MRLTRLMAGLLGMAVLCSPCPVAAQGPREPLGQEEAFQLLDKNRDGRITREEFVGFWKNPHTGAREFQQRDADGDGVISREEYLKPGGLGSQPPPAKE